MANSGSDVFLSVVVPAPAGAPDAMALVDSLRRESSGRWELLVVGAADGVAGAKVRRLPSDAEPTLASSVATAIREARGEFVTILGPEDTVAADLIERMLVQLDETPLADVVYTDESFHAGGRDFLKPDFSPERLRSQSYLGNITAFRRSLLNSIGGMRTGIAGAEIYDLALRATRAARAVSHVRAVLGTSAPTSIQNLWNPDVEGTLPAIRTVLEEHLAATGGGRVESVGTDGLHRTHRAVVGEPLISIVIPTRGDVASVRGVDRCMVVEAVRGVMERSTYRNVEFVVVIDDVASQSVRDDLVEIAGERMRFVDWTGPFSFSRKMNLGVLQARGEYVLLLNDDIELITRGWIESLLALAQLPGAGMVGPMLYFEDDTIQHAGHAYWRNDVTHIGLHSERGAAGPFDGFLVEREVAGDTGACTLMSKALYLEAGGFSHLLPGNFNDVDLCMKVLTLGYQSYWTPYVELYHFESKSRDPRVAAYEINTAWGRWQHLLWDSPMWPTDPHELFTADRVDSV